MDSTLVLLCYCVVLLAREGAISLTHVQTWKSSMQGSNRAKDVGALQLYLRPLAVGQLQCTHLGFSSICLCSREEKLPVEGRIQQKCVK